MIRGPGSNTMKDDNINSTNEFLSELLTKPSTHHNIETPPPTQVEAVEQINKVEHRAVVQFKLDRNAATQLSKHWKKRRAQRSSKLKAMSMLAIRSKDKQY